LGLGRLVDGNALVDTGEGSGHSSDCIVAVTAEKRTFFDV